MEPTPVLDQPVTQNVSGTSSGDKNTKLGEGDKML